jgi:hypothetical protein
MSSKTWVPSSWAPSFALGISILEAPHGEDFPYTNNIDFSILHNMNEFLRISKGGPFFCHMTIHIKATKLLE